MIITVIKDTKGFSTYPDRPFMRDDVIEESFTKGFIFETIKEIRDTVNAKGERMIYMKGRRNGEKYELGLTPDCISVSW